MSAVLFASVVRVGDGLPLSASTDYEQDKEILETKKQLKGLSKKLGQFPDRCTLKSGPYNVNVLAFCFLDELQKEFIVSYDPKRIAAAVRPYSFIEFDTFIQKTKQRYNSPRSLSTRINLADMQTEIRLRPPVLCGGLNLLRGVHAIESILQNDDEDFNYVIAFFLGTAACLYQCFLFARFSVWRSSKSLLALALD
ncbi:unnamed protein product [Menidia menidia]|uniref:(Atlantic silverside) hypothetical protein n=1 Tax=Menidia menidia TaxID=238744 RepID=A0A8S4AEM0_9TELE|nr:unnamed protein product [Menidia menidia]